MSVEELKQQLVVLSDQDQRELSAFLFNLRHAKDDDYQRDTDNRLADRESTHWLTPSDFENELDQRG